MSARETAFELVKDIATPEAETLRWMFGTGEVRLIADAGISTMTERDVLLVRALIEDLARQYVIARAVAKGYASQQLDADLEAAVAAAKSRRH